MVIVEPLMNYTMKRFYSFMAAALTLITAASCIQELPNEAQHPENTVVYKAIADGADTKAVLGTNESGRPQSMWEDGDNIIVYVEGGQSFRFSTTLDEPSFSADFTYDGDDFPSVQVVTAIYPDLATGSHPEAGWIITFNATDQLIDPATDSYAKYSVPSVAYSTDNTLNFKNATSLLKFQVSKSDISKISFTAKGEEIVSGACVYSFDSDGTINGYTASEGENYASLCTMEGGTFHSGKNYYLSVLPAVLESGFVIELTDVNGVVVYTKEYDRSITIKRNVILDLGTLGEESSDESADYIDEYGVNHGPGVEIDGVVWAPVNCGYHETDFKYGKLYQWGRKYGQGYGNDEGAPVVSESIFSLSQIQSSENQNVYFTGLFDYYVQNFTSSELSALWNLGTKNEPVKSEYDPCPNGWRIPLHSEYENLRQNYSELTEENSIPGYWFCGSVPYSMEANQVFLPLAGGRDFGQARDRNELGYYYSSKPGGFFGLYEDGPHMVNYSQYSLACSVRCVQDDSEYISQETILWEGEAIADDWNNQPYLLSDGGVELLNAGAQPGQKVCFYVEPLQSDWKVDIWEGHWGPVYLSVCSVGNDTDGGKFTEYDLDANGGKIELTLTQDILDTAYTQQWWGGTFLLSGDNLKCTKITLQ